jgi:hypothetical protein
MPQQNPRVVAVAQLREAKRQLNDAILYFVNGSGTMTYDRPASLSENVIWRERRPDEFPENQPDSWVLLSNVTANVAQLMAVLNQQAEAEHKRIFQEAQAGGALCNCIPGEDRHPVGGVPNCVLVLDQ